MGWICPRPSAVGTTHPRGGSSPRPGIPGTGVPPIAGVTSQQSHQVPLWGQSFGSGTLHLPGPLITHLCLVIWGSQGRRTWGALRVSHQPCLPSRPVSRAPENQRPHSGGHLPGSRAVPRSSRTAGGGGNVTLAVPRTCPNLFLPTTTSGTEARGRVSRPSGTESPRHPPPMSQMRMLRPREAEPTVRGDRA